MAPLDKLLFILAITVPTTTTGIVKLGKEQYSCYGNVLGRVSLTKGGDDVKLLKILRKITRSEMINITSLYEMIHYYSSDGITIQRILFQDRRQCYDIPIQIGRLYTVHYVTMATEGLMSGHVTINVDNYDNYHIYSHTHQEEGSTSKNTKWPSNFKKFKRHNLQCSPDKSDWSPVTIATFNIWNVNSTERENHNKRLNRLAKVLGNIDIIGFQEVRTIIGKSKTISQTSQLHKALPDYQFVYQPAMLMEQKPREEEGVAIFSRYPIISTNAILLPWNRSDPSDFHQRVCLHCRIALPNDIKLEVFVTHLSLSEEGQMNSVKAIIDYIKLADFKGPLVIMGDFNNEDDSLVIKYLNEKLNRLGLVDVWLNNNNNNNGNTFCTLDTQLTKRIDYIYVQLYSHFSHLYINSTDLIGSQSDSPPLSDHLGLAVKLNFN